MTINVLVSAQAALRIRQRNAPLNAPISIIIAIHRYTYQVSTAVMLIRILEVILDILVKLDIYVKIKSME